jgi:hypothetical protein
MAFTVEDGTGLAAANAYLSVADFKTHHDDRGGDYSAHADTAIEQGIVQATDYINKRFGRRFRGDKGTYAQGLEWPRVSAYTDEDYTFTGVPAPLQMATAEYALIALRLARDLAPIPEPSFGIIDPTDGSVTPGGGQVVEKAEEVGPIKDTTKWAPGGATGGPMVGTGNMSQQIPAYPQADLWIEEVIDSYTSRGLYRG